MRRSEVPLLEDSPESYMSERFYVGSQPIEEPEDPDDLRKVIEAIGTDRLLFATDYPHWDFDHPEALDKHLRHTFDDDQRDKVLFENARRVFGLGV